MKATPTTRPFRWQRRFRSGTALLTLGLLCVAAQGCDDSAMPPPTSSSATKRASGLTEQQAKSVIAKVGDREITLGEYALTLERMNRHDGASYQTKTRRRELLSELIDLELLAQEARRRGLDKNPKVQDAIRQVMREAAVADARAGLPLPSDISDKEVADYYQAHRSRYVEPPRRRLTAIVLGDEDKAKEVLKDALAMESQRKWGDLFFEHSLTAPATRPGSDELAGDLGMVTRPDGESTKGEDAVPNAVRRAAFEIKKIGDVYPSLIHEPAHGPEHPDRYYVVRLVGQSAGHTRTLSEAEASIRVAILQTRLKEVQAATEAKLRKKYRVQIDEQALKALGESTATKPAPSGSN